MPAARLGFVPWTLEIDRTKANKARDRLAHMGTGLLTDCTCLSSSVGQGFKDLFIAKEALACIYATMRGNKGI